MNVLTLQDLEGQEQSLLEQEARLDHLLAKHREEVEGTRDSLSAIRGALLQVRAQKQHLKAKAQEAQPAPAKEKGKARRRGKVLPKAATPVVTDSGIAPEGLGE